MIASGVVWPLCTAVLCDPGARDPPRPRRSSGSVPRGLSSSVFTQHSGRGGDPNEEPPGAGLGSLRPAPDTIHMLAQSVTRTPKPGLHPFSICLQISTNYKKEDESIFTFRPYPTLE